MSNQEILEKAIKKAIDNGWKPPLVGDLKGVEADMITGEYFAYFDYAKGLNSRYCVIGIVYADHDFAKALWPTPCVDDNPLCSTCKPWQYHLQQMVISDDPIKYLGDNL